ncbi:MULTISPECIES: hypothetical protein [Cryobacterium]|uniref:Uncharacterized protein n=1 Tax=Cryobacterium zhongshanensis TaxID=2928153 RepID=A0AA41QWP3_9MICO|nr:MULTISPECIES: hypothetical protein [Cryobacterium]MCI4658695.1 hypothetical protein [Cryobacterium zhongshanensis]
MHPLISYFASLDSPGVYLGWGAFQIQLGNLIVILVMILLFVLALFLPFPSGKKRP